MRARTLIRKIRRGRFIRPDGSHGAGDVICTFYGSDPEISYVRDDLRGEYYVTENVSPITPRSEWEKDDDQTRS